MSEITFYKYQGTGNDFVMIDNLSGQYDNLSIDDIKLLCDRRFGVGADGVIKLDRGDGYDFYVDYYNSDGSQSFCGNGARCSVAFAKYLGVIKEEAWFGAIDGEHLAYINADNIVRLKMSDVYSIEENEEDIIMDTGSPHFIAFDTDENIVQFGKKIRYSERFLKEGINVNIVKSEGEGKLYVQTYERGVEDETLSCGTGVTACALAEMLREGLSSGEINVRTKGGELSVAAEQTGNGFTNIYLIGPAAFVYKGEISL